MSRTKVFIYARISRDDNYVNYESIQSQVELLKSFVKRQNLGIIIGIYTDDNVSGSTFDRPELNSLKTQISMGNVDILVVKDLSRLGRNNASTLLFLDWAEERGVRVVTADGRYDSSEDNELAGLDTWFNERYIRDISAKTRASIRHKQEQGLYLAKAPYGYRKDQKNKYLLIVNPQEAQVVVLIFSNFLKGKTPVAIAERLAREGYRTPGGLQPENWNSTMIRRILQNQTYMGNTVSGKTRRLSFKNKKILRVPEDEQLIKYNTHEAIISKKDFELAAKFLKKKTYYKRKGIGLPVHCGDCGKLMYRRRTGDVFGYVCSTYTRYGSEQCSRHFFNEELLEKEIASALKEVISQNFDDTVKGLILLKNEKIHQQLTAREKLETKLKASYMDYLDGLIDKGMFLQVKSEISSQLKKIELCDGYQDKIEKELKEVLQGPNFASLLDRDILEQFVDEIHIYNKQGVEKNRRNAGTIALVKLNC